MRIKCCKDLTYKTVDPHKLGEPIVLQLSDDTIIDSLKNIHTIWRKTTKLQTITALRGTCSKILKNLAYIHANGNGLDSQTCSECNHLTSNVGSGHPCQRSHGLDNHPCKVVQTGTLLHMLQCHHETTTGKLTYVIQGNGNPCSILDCCHLVCTHCKEPHTPCCLHLFLI
jgi:hypothetical protein